VVRWIFAQRLAGRSVARDTADETFANRIAQTVAAFRSTRRAAPRRVVPVVVQHAGLTASTVAWPASRSPIACLSLA
jgi:hypothetical protein